MNPAPRRCIHSAAPTRPPWQLRLPRAISCRRSPLPLTGWRPARLAKPHPAICCSHPDTACAPHAALPADNRLDVARAGRCYAARTAVSLVLPARGVGFGLLHAPCILVHLQMAPVRGVIADRHDVAGTEAQVRP